MTVEVKLSPTQAEALSQLFAVLRRGGDPSVIMRSNTVRVIERKIKTAKLGVRV